MLIAINSIFASAASMPAVGHSISELFVDDDIDMGGYDIINSGNLNITGNLTINGNGNGVIFSTGDILTSSSENNNIFEKNTFSGGGSSCRTYNGGWCTYGGLTYYTYTFGIDTAKILLGGYTNVSISTSGEAYTSVYINGNAIASYSVGYSGYTWGDINIQQYLIPGTNTFTCVGGSSTGTNTEASCNIKDIRIYYLTP
ncbi:MAG: hypothetical protein GQ477_04865 [Nanohaloarchaea archaeon]|nr:hypothetical protein [Candidatus Nanohaloarchaea archaeon]